VTLKQHGTRVGLLMALAAALLGWLSAHTDIVFADGLRYIHQAQSIDQGAWVDGVLKAVDHPAYPLAIVATHRWIGGDGPEAWQSAAQTASVVAGILLVIPLYLTACELFGSASAWLACLLIYAVPLTGHVMADALSESTFLLFWTWGLWTSLRFLRAGAFRWLPLTVGFGALAYLSRPEGLLLPAALVASLVTMPLLRSTRLNWPRWWAAIAFLVIGAAAVVGPYVIAKGGLGTKPAIARLLGTAPRSPSSAVERMRPLDANQSTAKTYISAFKSMCIAVRDAVTIPLLPLALLGLALAWPPGPRARMWLFVAIIEVASALALVRLHATGGYCSPRHAMVLANLLITAAGFGLHRGLTSVAIPGRWLGLGEGRFRPGPAVWGLVLGGLALFYVPADLVPVNQGFGGYRDAGEWLARTVPPESPVVDVTGWSLYYGQRTGYTFANLHEAPGNPNVRWVVAREAHLRGPWTYCEQLRGMVAGRKPVAVFPTPAQPHEAQIFIFDRLDAGSPTQSALSPTASERR
jgi:Dolichyl-phosphate-mannose-protein mannosyltransferase